MSLFGGGTFGAGVFGGLAPFGSGLAYSIEVAFSNVNPLSDPGTWTDITPYVRSLSTRRGRNHELGRTQAGVASITLDNRDRRFDPTYTSSPYYPNVLPMKHVRVRAVSGVTTYEVFRGYVEDWGQTWGGPAAAAAGDAIVPLAAVDAFKVLSLVTIDTYSAEVLKDGPLGYWKFDDPVGTRDVASYGSVEETLEDLSLHTGTTLGVPGPITYGGATAAEWSTTAQSLRVLPVGGQTSFRANGDVTYEAWIRPVAYPASARDIMAVDMSGSVPGQIGITTTGQIRSGHELQGGALESFTSTGTIPTGAWSHVAIVVRSRVVELWVNGVLETLGTLSRNPNGTGVDALIGTSLFNVRLAHVAIYNKALSPNRITTHYARRWLDVLTAQSSGTAITAILDTVGWPSALRSIETGASTVTLEPSGSALDILQQIAEDTEHGILVVATDGKVTFIGRDTLEERVTALATFGDGGGAEIPYGDLQLTYDDQDLWTEVTATSPAGEVTVSDPTAIGSYGTRTLGATTLAATLNEVADQANGLLNRYKAPAVRPRSMSLRGSRSIDQQLARVIGDRVTVKRRPPGGGTLTVDALIEGVDNDLGPDGWPLTTFQYVPSEPSTFWLLADTTYGVLGSTTRLGW